FREVKKKQIVRKNSKTTYLLMDSSKNGITTLCKVFELNECNIITNQYHEILEKFNSYVVVP
ncbi:MAG: DeoR/GlpR transcriptional regulator, partial [Clostridia bacterium]|nr:DeoR/GlpR transcriptional regulator [Clostridia bacterium]